MKRALWKGRIRFFSMFLEISVSSHFMSFLQQLVKIAISSKTASLTCFSLPVLLFVVHIYAILVYAPFGVCSIWNIIRYGLFSVYEDPVRVPAYWIVFLRLIQISVGKIHFLKSVCCYLSISFP